MMYPGLASWARFSRPCGTKLAAPGSHTLSLSQIFVGSLGARLVVPPDKPQAIRRQSLRVHLSESYSPSFVVAGRYISRRLGRPRPVQLRRRESQLPAKECSFLTDNIRISLGSACIGYIPEPRFTRSSQLAATLAQIHRVK
jgi:hypothetical protein